MAIEHFLLTNATVEEFLAHMNDVSQAFDRKALIDIWRAARKAMGRLHEREAGCADQAAVLPLPPAMQAQSDAVTKSPLAIRAHNLVPVSFALVEVDALMTTRHTLNEAKLAAVRSTVTAYPDDPELARVCLSASAPAEAVDIKNWDGQSLSVVTEAEDVRLLQCDVLTGAALTGTVAPGVPHVALQWVLGGSLPLMHAVRFNGRVLLVKGHHRAHVLRAKGVTYVPCLISSCESMNDVFDATPMLDRTAVGRCFSLPRPTMLRDFDRSAFTHRHEARARQRLLQVRVEITSQWLPAKH